MEHVATSTNRNNVDSGCTRDYTSEFTTTETFNSKEELIIWVKNVGKENGITIVVLRSDSGKGKKKPRVTLGCERSGKCDGRNLSPKKSITVESKGRHTGTKKCDCPFRLRGEKLAASNEWELTVDVGVHNHAAGTPECGHSSLGRLYREEKFVVEDRYKRGEKPKQILRALKERDKHNQSTYRTIYNEVQSSKRRDKLEDESSDDFRIKKSSDDFWERFLTERPGSGLRVGGTAHPKLEDETEKREDSYCRYQNSRLQQLMSRAEEYDYIEKHRTSPMKDNVFDFFLTHPSSFELLRVFPTVLVIHRMFTGKIWETVEFLGVTSTDMIFSVATAILSSEYISGYEWALNSLRDVMDDNGIVMPDIVILDTYLTADIFCPIKLIKASKDVFSTAKLLFSAGSFYHHVYHLRWSAINGNRWASFYPRWNLLVASPTEADFQQHSMQLRTESSGYPESEAVEYFIDTSLKFKETFVAAWTNKVMHFGNIKKDLSRDHLSIRNIVMDNLEECEGSVVVEQTVIDTFLKCMHSLNEKSRLKIDGSFLESLKKEYIDDVDGLPVLKELHGAISIYALNMIREQTLLANKIDDDRSECSCAIKRTHGLPCAHEIAKYKREGRPIPLDCINPHWRKLPRLKPLRMTGEPNVHETLKRPRLNEEMNTNAHYALSSPGSIVEYERYSPNAGPSILPSTPERQPAGDEVYDIQTTKQLEFVDVCPLVLTPYISHVKDVPRDGHCGFRAIAAFMGYSEVVGWVKVREDLRNELMINAASYAQLFGSDQRVNELFDALANSESICLQKKHWMTMPDMGHIIASCYNVVLMHLSSVQCFTFFPLRTAPISISISSPIEIVIGFVEEHFVQVYLKAGHPMPPPISAPTKKNPHVATIWERFHDQRSTEWATPYLSRIEDFKSSQPEVVSQKNPIVVDIDSLPSVENMYYYFDSLQGD